MFLINLRYKRKKGLGCSISLLGHMTVDPIVADVSLILVAVDLDKRHDATVFVHGFCSELDRALNINNRAMLIGYVVTRCYVTVFGI